MKTFLLQAPRDYIDGGIPRGYILQVISTRTGSLPDVTEVIDALRRAGFSKRAESWAAPGNWIIKEMKL
jgi:hypothetical protein